MTEFDLIWTDEEKQEAEKEAYNQALEDVLKLIATLGIDWGEVKNSDIYWLEKSVERLRSEVGMTEEEYFKTDGLMNIKCNRYSEPLYICPKCGENMVCRDLKSCLCLTSDPPRYIYKYQCLNETCDYEVTR